jgi:hypothetical protein
MRTRDSGGGGPAEMAEPPPPPRERGPLFGGGMMSSGSEFEEFLLQRAGMSVLLIFVVGYKIMSAAHYSARIFNGGAPEHDVEDIPGILWRFTHDPLNPNEAFVEVNRGTEIPGAGPFWLVFAVVFAVHMGAGYVIYRWIKARRERESGQGGPWADDAEVADLVHAPTADPAADDRLVVGRRHGTGRSAKDLSLHRLESLLVVGPSYAGKSKSITVPTLLEWDGPALVVTTKMRTIADSIEWRRTQGRARVYDPSNATNHQGAGWSMLSYAGHWEGAIHMAQHLTAGAYGAAGWSVAGTPTDRQETSSLWGGAMAMSLAPYLYAGAADGRSMLGVAEWLEREERQEVLAILEAIDDVAAHAFETSFYRQDEERSAYLHHVYQMLSIYADPVVAASATKNEIMPDELLNGRSNTYYLAAAAHDRARFQPLFATIVRQTLAAVNREITHTSEGLSSPLLVVVDGAMGAASLQLLATMSLTGRERGVEVLTVINERDWEQATLAGVDESMVKSHRAVLMLHGAEMDNGTVTSNAWQEVAHEVGPDEGALFYENRRAIRVGLRSWGDADHLRQRVESPTDALPPEQRPSIDNPAPVEEVPEYDLVGQTSAWNRRSRRSNDEEGPAATVGNGRSSGSRMNVFQREG